MTEYVYTGDKYASQPGAYRRAKTRRRVLRRAFKRVLLFCVCFALMVSAGVLLAQYFLRTMAREPVASIIPPGAEDANAVVLPWAGQRQAGGGNAPLRAEETQWQLVLVNKWNPVPEEYNLELVEFENGQQLDARIAPALREMLDAARRDGAYATVVSGYRTAEQQQKLLDDKIAAYQAEGYPRGEAAKIAELWVAKPGASEHQLGIAVDINADGINSERDAVYQWLETNSAAFGFIRRYPPGKSDVTGVADEPWHYRYVGVEAATEMQEQGLCLEEYLIS